MKIELEIETPRVPNFLIIKMPPSQRQDGFKESPKVKVGDLSDAQLIQLGNKWLQELLVVAEKQRQGGVT